MLSKKSKGLFLEFNRFSALVAQTTSFESPMTLESLYELPRDDSGELEKWFEDQLSAKKGARFLPAHCAVYPVSRFFRRHTVESMAKAKDEGFTDDILKNQLKLDPGKLRTSVLNAYNGSIFSPDKARSTQKELLFCGAEATELDRIQEEIVANHVFPESLQLGTLSTMAGLMHYLQVKSISTPVLLLEMTPENAVLIVLNSEKVDLCRPIPFGFHSMFPLVQQELGLKDEESAKKLFYSDTFDFTEIGASLLRKALKELQASTGFYEVQTGQSISHFLVTQLPPNLKWITDVLAQEIGIQPLEVDFHSWLDTMGVAIGEDINLERLSNRWFGLFSMFAGFEQENNGSTKEEK